MLYIPIQLGNLKLKFKKVFIVNNFEPHDFYNNGFCLLPVHLERHEIMKAQV